MSFVADELVKWRENPVWYDRINFDEYENAGCYRVYS